MDTRSHYTIEKNMGVHLLSTGNLATNKEGWLMLTGVHFLLTYQCNFQCDHCFLYCSPTSKGTFTIDQVVEVLDEARKMGSVDWIFYEGGEPFLFFPLLVEGVHQARKRGFKVGVVTNAYGATSEADAELWLEPLANAGITSLSISNDTFHYAEDQQNPAVTAFSVAKRLGMDTASICIEPPKVVPASHGDMDKGDPVVGGGAKFRGRAVEKLSQDLPLRPWTEFETCPYEALESPSRVHVDPYGHVHICQGISMGNMWQVPLSKIVSGYQPEKHPISGPLTRGGPAKLAKDLGVAPSAGYVDACHLCFLARKASVDEYPDYLAPRQVYGLT